MAQRQYLIIILFIFCILFVLTGFRYHRYINDDPAFCNTCHISGEGYKSWQRSKHSEVVCQRCHKINIIDGNALLLNRFIKNEQHIKPEHGELTPWETCRECHFDEAKQGAITPRKSYGHARHVFMQGIDCSGCHTAVEHEFYVEHTKCQSCHPEKLVHGMGTAGTYCLNCHNFKDKSSEIVSDKRCGRCHENKSSTGVMSRLKCYDCHHPHQTLTMKSKDCLGSCHGSEQKIGQHALHYEQLNLDCMKCHRPHQWIVGKENSVGLCDSCHPYRDPSSFVF